MTPYSKVLERKRETPRLLGPAVQSQTTWPPSRRGMGPERHVLAGHQAMQMLSLH
ncbi:rCG21166 [Rattus norvegicus]|uniref:RCG21166 n=1 Tax=Rattus norvegicus TaxID=10116 RepID=A6J251_RAT|nr:rCG21166 [Rattus norvegicus]